MRITNADIAVLFDDLADLLDIEGENPFRVRAYRMAAETLRTYPKSIAELVEAGQPLPKLPGIGKDLAEKIETAARTGRLPLLEEVSERTPRTLCRLLRIQGLGPKRVRTLHRELGISTVEDLRGAVEAGQVHALPGFGEKTEEVIREGLEALEAHSRRLALPDAEAIADALLAYLSECRGVKELVAAGSYRRRKETVGDLDVLATVSKGSPLIEHFVAYDGVVEVLSHGTTRSTVRLRSGLQVDLRVVPKVSYGSALHYFTGSKAHNIAVRTLGLEKGYKINEYGVFADGRRIAGSTEASVYRSVGLAFVPPELREDRGEIDAARRRTLPRLVGVEDIRGDLHCHTSASDGRNTLEEMAEAAAAHGYEYLSITDHSKHSTVARGLDERRLLEQIRAIDALNEKLDGIRVLKSSEVDILEDGRLDLPDSVLQALDLTVCSVHDRFNLPRERQTERILRAMDNPHFTILGHPTGRRLNEREPYAVDLEKLMIGARERGCFLEVSAQTARLDLNDEGCRLAKEVGVKVAISTDSHSAPGLNALRFGVDQARRGWLTPDDVINTRPLSALTRLLRR